jgi:hypothetical protein
VRHLASVNPDWLVIGVDANVDALRESSRRFAVKPARGGLPNALLGRLALADAPGELVGLADSLTVLLPWGSLLRAVAVPDRDALRALRRICRTGAELRVVFVMALVRTSQQSARTRCHRSTIPRLSGSLKTRIATLAS